MSQKHLMQILFLILSFTVIGAVVAVFIVSTGLGGDEAGFLSMKRSGPLPRAIHAASFLDPDIFDRYFSVAALGDLDATEEKVISGVIPHHLVAGVYKARFFKTLARQEPPVVEIGR